MSGKLNKLVEDFDRRMAVRRHMFAHLGIDVPESRAGELRDDLRTTLLSCGSCANPEACELWIALKTSGMPLFCSSRSAFLRLQSATGTAAVSA